MQAHAHAVLNAAYESGIRYFDAARSYGRAEAFLGSWLAAQKFKPGEVVVGSKWGYTYTADWQIEAEAHEVKEHSLTRLQQQWAETQALLSSHLSLYQIHSATLESGVLENDEVLRELARIKAEAGIAIGLSVSGAAQAEVIRRAVAVEVDGTPLFDRIQATWNLLEPAAGDALEEAHAAGCFIVVKEALANGRLTERNREAKQIAALRFIASEVGASMDQLALAAVLQQPWCGCVLSGAATVEHLHSNVGAIKFSHGVEWSTGLGGLAETSETYWATRQRLAWN